MNAQTQHTPFQIGYNHGLLGYPEQCPWPVRLGNMRSVAEYIEGYYEGEKAFNKRHYML